MSSVMDKTTNPSPCIVSSDWQDSTVIVRCVGVVDMLTAPELEREIAEALGKEPTMLVVDLTAVDFLASCGMSVLIATHDECAATVRFVVVADGPATSRPMELIGLSDIIDVRPTVEAALAEKAA